MIKISGKGVCGGIAIGKVSKFDRGDVKVKRAHV